MKLSGAKVDNQTWILASAADCLSVLVWQNTKNGSRGTNMPSLFTDAILGMSEKTTRDILVFDTPEEYERARLRYEGGDE